MEETSTTTDRETAAERLFLAGNNCAQSVFGAFASDLGIGADTALRVACGLGGGVGRLREVCGAVSAAALVLGMRHGPDKTQVYPTVQDFAARFKAEAGSIVCRELLEGTGATSGGLPETRTAGYYAKRPCVELVKLAVRILLEMENAS